jgi:hypothetical protein
MQIINNEARRYVTSLDLSQTQFLKLHQFYNPLHMFPITIHMTDRKLYQ